MQPTETAALTDDTPIDDLPFDVRIWNALEGENIRTVGDLAGKRLRDIMAIRHLGERSVGRIVDVLRQIGRELQPNPPIVLKEIPR